MARGWAIELDVRLLEDGTPVVFHDVSLSRLCGIDRPLRTVGRGELDGLRLPGSSGTIPTLDTVLAAVDGAVPLIVELKPQGRSSTALAAAVHASLARYAGPAAALSFDPRIVTWFARTDPTRPRGLNIGALPTALDRIALARPRGMEPHFAGAPVGSLPTPLTMRLRERGTPVLAYTVMTGGEQATAEAHADGMFVELWRRDDPVRFDEDR